MQHDFYFFPLNLMNIAKLTSVAALASIAFGSTIAFAADYSANTEARANFRAQVQTCRSIEAADEQKTCLQELRTNRPKQMRNIRANMAAKANLTDEAKAELKACRDTSTERSEQKTCMDAVLTANGIEAPARPMHADRPELSAEVKAELEVCKNNTDREAGKVCATAVFEANGLKQPQMGMYNRSNRMFNKRAQ